MNLLLSKSKSYQTTIPREEIEKEIERLTYLNHSRNLVGSVDGGGKFQLKWHSPFVIVDNGGIMMLSRLKGHITIEGQKHVS